MIKILNRAKQVSVEITQCPYCSDRTSVELPEDYRPVYAYCDCCGQKFIAERLAEDFQVLTMEEAPCCSDPDCREIEMGGYEEE